MDDLRERYLLKDGMRIAAFIAWTILTVGIITIITALFFPTPSHGEQAVKPLLGRPLVWMEEDSQTNIARPQTSGIFIQYSLEPQGAKSEYRPGQTVDVSDRLEIELKLVREDNAKLAQVYYQVDKQKKAILRGPPWQFSVSRGDQEGQEFVVIMTDWQLTSGKIETECATIQLNFINAQANTLAINPERMQQVLAADRREFTEMMAQKKTNPEHLDWGDKLFCGAFFLGMLAIVADIAVTGH